MQFWLRIRFARSLPEAVRVDMPIRYERIDFDERHQFQSGFHIRSSFNGRAV